jgi:hypothetical protein
MKTTLLCQSNSKVTVSHDLRGLDFSGGESLFPQQTTLNNPPNQLS